MKNELLENIERIHTTELGQVRIKRNLELDVDDAVVWCKDKITTSKIIYRKGKNWYVEVDDVVMAVNASSYTIITAHKKKR